MSEITTIPAALKRKSIITLLSSNNNFKQNPTSEITPKEIIHPFKREIVVVYKRVEKNKSNKDISSYSFVVGTLAPILNVIKTVRRVKIKPANVSETVDRSVVKDNSASYLGDIKQ